MSCRSSESRRSESPGPHRNAALQTRLGISRSRAGRRATCGRAGSQARPEGRALPSRSVGPRGRQERGPGAGLRAAPPRPAGHNVGLGGGRAGGARRGRSRRAGAVPVVGGGEGRRTRAGGGQRHSGGRSLRSLCLPRGGPRALAKERA